jgi:hypothetical protein
VIARLLLPRTVLVLGFVSLLNDAASEMITPLLPIFLTATLGAGPAIVGLVEGLAEATASVLKLISGRLADRGVPAKGLVVGGYGLSNTVRPLLGLATAWGGVILLRFLDRVGKGLRTAPRDALIAGAVVPNERGRAFGFHRSMDHAGAVIGPLVAFGLLAMQADLKQVFLASVVPGALVLLLLLFGLPAGERVVAPARIPFAWGALHVRLRALILAAGALALASVPEVFVVLWATEAGMAVVWVPLVWAAASLAKMLIAHAGRHSLGSIGTHTHAAGWLVGTCHRVVAARLRARAVASRRLDPVRGVCSDAGRDGTRREIIDWRPRGSNRAWHCLWAVSPDQRFAGATRRGYLRFALAGLGLDDSFRRGCPDHGCCSALDAAAGARYPELEPRAVRRRLGAFCCRAPADLEPCAVGRGVPAQTRLPCRDASSCTTRSNDRLRAFNSTSR